MKPNYYNNSGIDVLDHYADISIMVQLGSGSEREIEDIMLSRYACYIIVQNADSRKKVVALGQIPEYYIFSFRV